MLEPASQGTDVLMEVVPSALKEIISIKKVYFERREQHGDGRRNVDGR